jgi:hypothetical protein
MDCSAMVFVDEFLNFFNICCFFLVLGHPECFSFSSDIQPTLKCECHWETTVRLKESSSKAPQSISRVSLVDLQSFTQNLMQTHCSILSSVADRTKHKSKRQSCKNSLCSQRGVTWQSDAIGLRKCVLPLSSSFTEAVTTVTVWELSDRIFPSVAEQTTL